MLEIRKRLVTDEQMRPIAVQIDYEDWLRIEKAIGMRSGKIVDLSPYVGTLKLTEDPLAFQERMRDEW